MIAPDDYYQLLPKTELHCHYASTMTARTFLELADRAGVELWTDDEATLFDFDDLAHFLVAFRAAHEVLREPADFERVAWEGVRGAVTQGLRYREYAVNPQYFAARGLSYLDVMEPIIAGLARAERDFGVGFRIVAAINRRDSAASAVELVRQVIANPLPEVVGIGQDDLTPELTEDPARFADAYALARSAGLKLTAHAGETPSASAENVRQAIEVLGCERVDHGYRIVDDPALVELARDRGIHFAATPVSTTICSGWHLDPDHRIRAMIDAGLSVSFSTDDALFFRTDLAREYREAHVALGLGPADAERIALAGIDGAFCDDAQKDRLRAQFRGEFAALDALLADPVSEPGANPAATA